MTVLPEKSYDELVGLVLEGSVCGAEREELAARLKANAALRRDYASDMYIHAVLCTRMARIADIARICHNEPEFLAIAAGMRENRWRRAAMVAGVLLGVCALLAGAVASVSAVSDRSGEEALFAEDDADASAITGLASAIVADPSPTVSSASSEAGQTNQGTAEKEKVKMNGLTKMLSGAGMVLATSTSSAGDGYRFYPEGYHPSGTDSSVVRSCGIALNTGAVRVPTDTGALEARYRTFGTSNTSKLNSFKYKSFQIIFR